MSPCLKVRPALACGCVFTMDLGSTVSVCCQPSCVPGRLRPSAMLIASASQVFAMGGAVAIGVALLFSAGQGTSGVGSELCDEPISCWRCVCGCLLAGVSIS